MFFVLNYNFKTNIVFENIDYITLGKRLHFKKLHTLFNNKMVIYMIYILMQIRLMKQTCIYMYPHSKKLIETPPLLCFDEKIRHT